VFFRSYQNNSIDIITSQKDINQCHLLFQQIKHELKFMEMDIHGINFSFILFSAPTSFNMREFVMALNNAEFLPIAHPTGFKQLIFVDYLN
jgi:hypothetical protein